MTTPLIGTFDFITLDGAVIPATGEQLQDITRQGVDGVAFRKVGKGSKSFTLKSMRDVATAAAAKTLTLEYKAAQATVVTVLDATGQSWTNLVVESVQVDAPKFVVSKSGGLDAGSSGYLVGATWVLRATETA